MTCMKQEFCIHEKYCQRHIGQNFDSCILFSRNSKPMTNEEWLKSMNTEQLEEFLHGIVIRAVKATWDGKKPNYPAYLYDWKKWLKQPHTTIKE